MKNLDKYIKDNATKMDCKQTSISIETKQHEFVLANNLNLSAMVRDMLAELMESPKAAKKRAS